MTVEELVNLLSTMDPKAVVLTLDFLGDNTRAEIAIAKPLSKGVGLVRQSYGASTYRVGHGKIPAIEIG
jgi:hypothetical protein